MHYPGKQTPADPKWATVHERVLWLVENRFRGSRSAMAKAIGFSHTVIANVVKGKVPGRRLLEAVVGRLHVDPVWLTTGQGLPFHDERGASVPAGTPVATAPLPGPLKAHEALITDWVEVPSVVAPVTAYWLALTSSQAIVRQSKAGFLPGDQLLMETDPSRFPGEAHLRDDLCVVRTGPGAEPRLARVTFYRASVDDGDARLEAEFPEPTKTPRPVVERTYRHLPGGEVRYVERHLLADRRGGEPFAPVIRYADIVSIWLKILRRPPG